MCEKCNSAKIREEIKQLNDDFNNNVKIIICDNCGHQKTELIHIN